jgi:hypothetical protein
MDRKSPNLEVISSGEPEGDASERRRLPRLNLASEQFRLASNGKIFEVTDLSPQGMALRVIDRGDLVLFPVAAKVDGTINLRGEKHPVSARVRNLVSDRVGCEFEELSAPSHAALAKFLDPVALGRELKPIPSEGGMLWYHGTSGTDLLLRREADGRFTRMALFVLGSFVQWTEDEGVKTGAARMSKAPSETRGVVRLETLLLDADPRPDAGKLAVARAVLQSSSLSEALKTNFVRKLSVGDK